MSVVISSSLVLSSVPTDGANANNPIVGWQNLATVANLSADTETIADPAANLANPSTYLRWIAANASAQHITVAHNAVDAIDYVGIAGHNFGSGQIPVSIEGDDGGGFDELVAPIMPADDGPLMFRFSPVSLEAVRVRLQAGLVPPTAAVVYVGRLLVLPRRIYVGHSPLKFSETDNTVTGLSETGQFLGRLILGSHVEGAIQQSNVEPDTYRSTSVAVGIEPWRKAAKRRPFFFAWRPGDYPAEAAYCWTAGTMRPANQLPNGMMQFSLQVQGIAA